MYYYTDADFNLFQNAVSIAKITVIGCLMQRKSCPQYIYINFVIRNTAMFVSVYKEPSSDKKTAVFLCSLSICNQCTNSVDVVCL